MSRILATPRVYTYIYMLCVCVYVCVCPQRFYTYTFYTYANLASSKSVSAYITVSRTMETNEQHSDLCYNNT